LYAGLRLAVRRDLAALRTEDERFRSGRGGGLFTAAHIAAALDDTGQLRYYTVPVLLQLLEVFAATRAHGAGETNVFLGADCAVRLDPMTVDKGRAAAEKYRDVLIYLDDVPAKGDTDTTVYDQCLFLRDLIRCLALPCLLSGTESALLWEVPVVHGSRCEGRDRWAWLLTRLPATRLDVPPARLSDYEKHLLSSTRPSFANWFVECSGDLPASAADPAASESGEAGPILMTPDTLSRMKHKICTAKLDGTPTADAWLRASAVLVFADSLGASGEAQVGEKRAAPAPGPPETPKKQKLRGLGDDLQQHPLLIGKHFAQLQVPAQLVDEHGMSLLYFEGRTVTKSDHDYFFMQAAFETCAVDPLLYLACLRGGLTCRGTSTTAEELTQVPSSYALCTLRLPTSTGYGHAKFADGAGLEARCVAACVMAAHRYTSFAGTPFFRWLALVVAELSAEPHFDETEIADIPQELRAALQEALVPLLSPPNCSWGQQSMLSEINFGNLSWYSVQGQSEGEGQFPLSQYEHMVARAYTFRGAQHKEGHPSGGADAVVVTMKLCACSVCLLIGAGLSAWPETCIEAAAPGAALYRMTTKGSIDRVTSQVPAEEGSCGQKVLIALVLKQLHPSKPTFTAGHLLK
jgi:hypothetical protein